MQGLVALGTIRGKKRQVDATASIETAPPLTRRVPHQRRLYMSEVVSSSEFQSKVLDAQGPVLVDFFATWCGPCKMLAPTLDEVATETAGKAAVYKLDIDQSPDIAQRYGVMSVPTLMVFENGQVKNQAVGVQPKQNILKMIG
jgi:thioredoxin 1